MESNRFFYGEDDDLKYYVTTPTAEDVRGADWQYSKTYTQCLMEGITTSAEMIDILNRRGIIGPQFEQRSKELLEILNNLIYELEHTEDMDTKRELSYSVAQARENYFQWNQRLNGPMNNTAEQISDEARLDYLTHAIVMKEDGSRVWKEYEDFLKEKSQSLALKARFEVMLLLRGFESDFLENTPEAVALREVNKSIMDQAEALILAAEAAEAEEELSKAVVEAVVSEEEVETVVSEESEIVEEKPKKKTKKK